MNRTEEKILLRQHEQLPLSTTRLPYRQGRKLTAVKVYTISDESNHLLIFGVPSLDLRQETKILFSKYGKLKKFSVSDAHASEVFTETYHAVFEKIQSARLAKRIIDTKNYYGGLLHVCYAPELETVEETRAKLLQRKRDVFVRIKRNDKECEFPKNGEKLDDIPIEKPKLIDMSENNVIFMATQGKKRKLNEYVAKPPMLYEKQYVPKLPKVHVNNVQLNYNNFGGEIIKQVEYKPLNKIKFNISKK